MRVLYVVGTNLRRNTSANISHNAYVQGLLENGCEVDILMSSASWGDEDDALPVWKDAKYFIYNSVSSIDKFKNRFKEIFDKKSISTQKQPNSKIEDSSVHPSNKNFKSKIRSGIKKVYDVVFDTSNIYNLDRTWLKNASKFKGKIPYDLIISNSSPASSHRLVLELLSQNNISHSRWVQIWEDPWYFDLYGGHNEKIRLEEHRLLRAAQEIYYVSPLTLEYQRKHFPDCAAKMKHIPLPFLQMSESRKAEDREELKFGYFGDYYSKTRNLQPFYEAALESKLPAYIYGDADLDLPSTEQVTVNGRVTLDKLNILQNQVDVLVHLCNLSGGQIPGKIYHYSATTQPILFILDGTETEKKMIKDYFIKFNRYHFCENTKEDILNGITSIKIGNEGLENQTVPDFAPKQVIAKILSEKNDHKNI